MPEYYIQPVTNRQECYTCHKVVTGKIKLSKCKRCHAITYCSRECQVKDWDRHKWNCVPVMVTEFEGKGRGLVAAKDIKRGELIFIDKPLIEVNGTKLQANKDTEGRILMRKVDKLPSEAKKQFYLLKGFRDKSFQDLQSSFGGIDATLNVFIKNSRVVNQQDHSQALYLNMALLNHSCAPNADVGELLESFERDDDGRPYKRIEIRAIKDISKGEEITWCVFGNINIICSSEARKMFIKEKFTFVCKCCACSSGLNTDQENIAMDLLDLLETLPSQDHYSKGLSEWSRDTEKLDRMNDLIQKFQLGNAEIKWRSMISLAKTAQLARKQDLVRKGLEMLKKFSEDIQMEAVGLVYENLKTDLTQWSSNLKSKKAPRRKEIEFFLTRNILSELKLHKLHLLNVDE